MAPDVERSSAGHSITANRPFTWKRTPLAVEAYRVDGTPADCVALGLSQWESVDVVLSGVNLGSNLGNSVWHSGTLAAAKQAALMGRRGIAFSVPVLDDEPDFESLLPSIHQVLEVLLGMRELLLLNVNFPAGPPGEIAWTRQSVRFYDGKVVPGTDPMGRSHFWFAVAPVTETEEGTDRWAVEHGLVSITPLRLDLTDESASPCQDAAHREDGQLTVEVTGSSLRLQIVRNQKRESARLDRELDVDRPSRDGLARWPRSIVHMHREARPLELETAATQRVQLGGP